MSRYLAFDLGSSNGRAILGELGDDDRLTVSEVHRFPNGMVNVDGHMHWDTPKQLTEVHEGMRRCGGDPDSIGVDSWGVDYALLDDRGKEIGLPYAYRDRRTEGTIDDFAKKMPLERLYERTGIQVIIFNTLFQLDATARDEPDTLRSAHRLLMIADYFNYKLTGVPASEFTLASTTHLVNPWSHIWDEEVISALGVPRRLFQRIVEPGTILGTLSKETRAATGLGDVPVAAVGCHDTGSAVAAVPAEGEDFAYISSGTWSLMGVESRKPIVNAASLRYNITNEGGVEGTYRVLKNIGGLWLLQECRRAWGGGYGYDELVALAEAARPHVAVIDPSWHGFLNPPSMPDAIVGYCIKTGQKTAPEPRRDYTRRVGGTRPRLQAHPRRAGGSHGEENKEDTHRRRRLAKRATQPLRRGRHGEARIRRPRGGNGHRQPPRPSHRDGQGQGPQPYKENSPRLIGYNRVRTRGYPGVGRGIQQVHRIKGDED